MKYRCTMCGEIYDEAKTGVKFTDLPEDWVCPVCGAPKSLFEPLEEKKSDEVEAEKNPTPLAKIETDMDYIQAIASTGEIIIEPAGAKTNLSPWSDILILAAQLAKQPLSNDTEINTAATIGKQASKPLVLEAPILISHMSYGALSGDTKVALAEGAKAAGVANESGEGGLYEPEFKAAKQFIFEYVPNKYSVTDENLQKVDAIEIKIGQSAKPGLGGHLPGNKVSPEIAKMRGFAVGEDIISPPAFTELKSAEDLKKLVTELRQRSQGRPIGVKIAANHIEADLAWIKTAEADFVTIDGRGGGTGAAPRLWKENAGIPTLYTLLRARKYMDENQMTQELIVTGGIRTSADILKCLALGADAVALASAILGAIAAPVALESSKKVENFLKTTIEELKTYARACGYDSLEKFSVDDLATTNDWLALNSKIMHA